jgi:hypothetical protein
MHLVSVASNRHGVVLWISPEDGQAPEALKLSHAEAAGLARDVTSALATELERVADV